MFPLVPNTAHFKSQLDVTFIGGAANASSASVYTFNAVGDAPGSPRDRVFVVAVARQRSSSTNQKLTQLTVNGVQASGLYLFDPGKLHDVYFAVVRHRSLVGPANVVASFDGGVSTCAVCVWCVDGMPGLAPIEMAEAETQSYTTLSLQLETPAGGVSFFAGATAGGIGNAISNTENVYRPGVYAFSFVDNSTGENVRTGPQSKYTGSGRVAGIAFAAPWGDTLPPWSPATLFANGEQGAWFDPSDLSSMYQDHLGGTPAVVGQPVGLILDRSQGQPGPQLGNMDLKPSDFTIAGGTVVITDLGDRLRLTRTAAAAGAVQAEYRSLPVQAGKTYEAEFRLLAVGGDSTVQSYTRINNGGATDFAGFGYQSSANINRRITVATGAGSGTLHLWLAVARGANPAASVEGDWIEVAKTFSVRELPGNHAKQPTTTARPTLMQSGAVPYLYRDPVDDELPWTAPVGSYDIVHIPLTGPATVLTAQALSGVTNTLLAENTRAYLAIDRRLTVAEIDALAAYYGASA